MHKFLCTALEGLAGASSSAQGRNHHRRVALRARRDNIQVRRTLDALQRAAEGAENTMPRLLDAVRAYATLGEICDSLRAVFGTYQETTHL